MEGARPRAYSPSMSTTSAVILSPHLDDAVLSCWHLLRGPGDVTVVNVFAGSPLVRAGAAWWDRKTGATDSVARMEERRAEDREAFAIAGRTAIDLDFLDEQYEPVGQPLDLIVERLRDVIDPAAVIYAPAALGDHGDHERVRSAAIQLGQDGQAVRLYADHPHAVRRGWPIWIDGTEPGAGHAVVAHWRERLGSVGLSQEVPAIHHLDAAEQRHKLRAVSAYRTQIRALGEAFGEVDGFPAFPHEFVWNLTDQDAS